MRVVHPRARDDDAGPPPASVDIRGESVTVDDDGTFECDDETWLQRFAASYDVDVKTITADAPAETEKPFTEASAAAFVDRTPVRDVADDILAGAVDEVLDEIKTAEEENRDRTTVYDAIDERRDELEA